MEGVIFGGVCDFAIGLIGMYHWGEDVFEVGTLQSILLYSFPSAPIWFLGHSLLFKFGISYFFN